MKKWLLRFAVMSGIVAAVVLSPVSVQATTVEVDPVRYNTYDEE